MASPIYPAGLADVQLGDLVHTSGKADVRAGEFHGRPVLVKQLRSGEPRWRAKFEHEIRLYRAFQTSPPPTRVPELLWTDGHSCLVTERVPGRVVDSQRYPQQALPGAVWEAMIRAVRRFGTWSPPQGTLTAGFDYPERLHRYHRKGFLTGHDREALAELLAECGEPAQVAHGDPIPANLLITDDQDCVLIDYEFTGLFLPAFDLAMLHTVLAGAPRVQQYIEAIVTAEGLDAPFTVNQAMVLSRELRIHTELPDGADRERHLSFLREQWAGFQNRLHNR